jgi:TatD DNase family protein
MNPPLYDAHNHLQDERFAPLRLGILEAARRENVKKMVVNGSAESDWPGVERLAHEYPEVVPCFGLHPWYLKERSDGWQKNLVACLDRCPGGIGEIGLDAWGRLLEILEAGPRPACGFLLHSFGGPREMIGPFLAAGAYFSLPGYFAHERKLRQRETFREVPPDRLLIETDAPDQPLPESQVRYPLQDHSGKAINHPANLGAVYQFAADWFGEPVERLALRVAENFQRLFGGLLK